MIPFRLLEVLIWGAMALLPLVLDEWLLSQLSIYLVYGLLAISLAFVWGQVGLLCFGQAVFFGIGAYAMSVITLAMVPGLEWAASSYLGLLLAMLLPALAANVLGRFLFYGKGLHGAYFGIVTLAIAVVAERLATNWDYLGGLNGLMNVPPMNLALVGEPIEVWDTAEVYYLNLGVVALSYLVVAALIGSRFGVVLRAIRDEEGRTAHFGYDTGAMKRTAFTIGAAIAGLAGALFVTQFGFASPPVIGFSLSTEALIWTALGGRLLPIAAFLGAILTRLAEGWFAELLGETWLLAMGALFVVSVVLLPRGLIGEVIQRLTERSD